MKDVMINTIFFDVGGTLLFVEWARVFEILCLGVGPLDERLGRLMYAKRTADGTARIYEYLACCLEAAGASVSDEQLAVLWQLHLEKNLWRVPAPEAEETLAKLLRRGFRLAVISNSEGKVRELLEETSLAQYFEIIVDSGIEGVSKPDKEIFLRACTRMQVNPAESLYVGDVFEIDVLGARNAGMRAALLDPHGLYREATSQGFLLLRSLPELTAQL